MNTWNFTILFDFIAAVSYMILNWLKAKSQTILNYYTSTIPWKKQTFKTTSIALEPIKIERIRKELIQRELIQEDLLQVALVELALFEFALF